MDQQSWQEKANTAYKEKLRSMGLPDEEADFSVLNERQLEALRLRYGEGQTLKKIGECMGVGVESVRQTIYRAFKTVYWAKRK